MCIYLTLSVMLVSTLLFFFVLLKNLVGQLTFDLVVFREEDKKAAVKSGLLLDDSTLLFFKILLYTLRLIVTSPTRFVV